jgi:hypothetical protein
MAIAAAVVLAVALCAIWRIQPMPEMILKSPATQDQTTANPIVT